MALTRIKFAARCAQFATMSAAWSRDILMPLALEGVLLGRADREPVERFIKDMRDRLDALERELNQ